MFPPHSMQRPLVDLSYTSPPPSILLHRPPNLRIQPRKMMIDIILRLLLRPLHKHKKSTPISHPFPRLASQAGRKHLPSNPYTPADSVPAPHSLKKYVPRRPSNLSNQIPRISKRNIPVCVSLSLVLVLVLAVRLIAYDG